MGEAQKWLSLLCLHLSCMLFSGLSKVYGVLLPTLADQFAAQAWTVGWMIAITGGVINFVGPLSGPLEFLFGPRVVLTVSGFMVGVSIVLASLSTNVVVMTLILVIGGPGISFSNILTRAMIARDFRDTYATASSIGTAGHATGTLILAPLTQLLLDTYGWRGTMMIIGGISMHLGVCGFLLRSHKQAEATDSTYHSVSSLEEAASQDAPSRSTAETTKKSSVTLRDALLAMRKRSGFSIFSQVSFWIGTVLYICARFVTNLWLIYFVAQAEAKGFSAYDAVTFTTAAGVGSIVFKFVCGPVVDRGWLTLRPSLMLLIGLGSSALIVTPWMTSFWLMMANAIVCFGACGAVGSLKDVFIKQTLGLDLLVSAFSWMELIAAILNITLGFFPGWIFDQTGSFDLAFVIMGCIWALSLVSLFAEWLLTRHNKK